MFGQLSRENAPLLEGQPRDGSTVHELKFAFKDVAGTNVIVTYKPPDVVMYSSEAGSISFCVHVTPMTSSSSRTFFSAVMPKKTSLHKRFLRAIRTAIGGFHMCQSALSDGDFLLIARQAGDLRHGKDGSGGRARQLQCFMPESCDAAVIDFRRYDKNGFEGKRQP